MRRRRGVPLLHLIVAVAVLAGCGRAPQQDATGGDGAAPVASAPAPPPDPSAAPPDAGDGGPSGVEPARWSPCGEGLECATVAVPLDHDEPDGATLPLALVRVPATDPSGRLGSLFVNTGGPGVSGVDAVTGGFRLDAGTMARYDLVGFDPRGIGGSAPLGCEPDLTSQPLPDPHPDDAVEAATLDAHARSLAVRCHATDGARLAHLDTYAVARDLDLLRRAVGDERLTYYGLSYGTLIGLRYLELFPERAGRVVLDGVVDPTATLGELLRQQAAGFERTFEAMVATCDTNPQCPPGGLADAYDRTVAMVDDDPVGGVGPAEVATAAIMSTYDPAIWGVLNEALTTAVTTGDVAGLEQLSDRYYTSTAFAAYVAVSCSDTPSPRGAAAWDALVAELAATSPRFGAATGNELRACAHWPVRAEGPPRAVEARGVGPVLVIGTTGDAATPLENAAAVADRLEGGHLLVHQDGGHTGYGDPCVASAVGAYLVDGRLPPPDSRC